MARAIRWGPALLLCGPLLLVACPKAADPATASGAAPAANTQPAPNNLDAAPPKSTTLAVRVVRAAAGPLSVERTASGIVKSSRDSNAAAQTSGVVARVLVTVGDRVAAGQPVLVLDDSTLRQNVDTARLQVQNAQLTLTQATTTSGQNAAQLGASLTSAQANLQKAQQTVNANRELLRLGGVSQADLTASEAALAQAQAEYAQARNSQAQNGVSGSGSLPLLRNQLAQAQAALAQAQDNLAKATLRAPFAGVVASLPVSVGEFLAAGATAVRIVDTSALSVEFSVSPGDVAGLRTGTPVNLSAGERRLTGRVAEGDGVAGSNRLVPVTVRLDGAPDLPVGGAVQVRYRLQLGQGLRVPVAAIQQTGGQNVVYLNVGGVARQTPVGLVGEAGDTAVVSGLKAGDAVISPLPPSLADGSPVSVTGAGQPARPAGAQP